MVVDSSTHWSLRSSPCSFPPTFLLLSVDSAPSLKCLRLRSAETRYRLPCFEKPDCKDSLWEGVSSALETLPPNPAPSKSYEQEEEEEDMDLP